jgi:hypothetical protein
MGSELVPVCGDEPFRHSSTLTDWALCNFEVLVFIVFVTIMVLLIVAMLSLARFMTTYRKI